MKPIFTLLFLLLFYFTSGCNENSVDPPEELPPIVPITSNNIIPLAIGNQWTYVDSLFYEDTVLVETYTVRIQSKRHIEDEEYIDRNLVWWKFNGRFNPSITAVEFASKGDTLYSLQESPGGTPPNFELVSISPIEYIIPEGIDTISFDATYAGDGAYVKKIIKLNGPISFANETRTGYLYLSYDAFFYHTELFVPEVGMVFLEIVNDTIISGQDWINRKIILTDFTLELPD